MSIFVTFHFKNNAKFVRVKKECEEKLCYGDFIEKGETREVFKIDSSIHFMHENGATLEDDEEFADYVEAFIGHPKGIILHVYTEDTNDGITTDPIGSGEGSSSEPNGSICQSSFQAAIKTDANLQRSSTSNGNEIERGASEEYCVVVVPSEQVEPSGDFPATTQLTDTTPVLIEGIDYLQANEKEMIASAIESEESDDPENDPSPDVCNLKNTEKQQSQAFAPDKDKSLTLLTLKSLKHQLKTFVGEEIFKPKKSGDDYLSYKQLSDVSNALGNLMIRTHDHWPTTQQKLWTARLAERLIPRLRRDVLYDPNCKKPVKGKLDQKLRLLQRNFSADTNVFKYKKRKARDAILSTEQQEEQSEEEEIGLSSYHRRKAMKTCVTIAPNHDGNMISLDQIVANIEFLKHANCRMQKAQIFALYKENYWHRRENLDNAINVYGNILKFFPELISYDFDQIYGSCDDALMKWQELKIDEVYNQRTTEKQKADHARILNAWCHPVAKVLKLLSFFRPVNTDKTGQKSKLIEALEHFVHFFPSSTPPEEMISSVQKRTTQPQLIAEGPNKKAVRGYFIILDEMIFPAPNNFFEALHLFFKAHYTFNVCFKDENANFFYSCKNIFTKILPKKMTNQC
ncbi:hypothetical protein DMENIID0001_039870 [Sergentomyia squamirostris]